MWTRRELKERGKASFKRFYMGAVIACLLVGFVSFLMEDRREEDNLTNHFNYTLYERADGSLDFEKLMDKAMSESNLSLAYKTAKTPSFMLFTLLILLARYLILNPLQVGVCHYFMRNRDEPTGLGAVFYAFKGSRYFHVCFVMFLRDLLIGLWSLLFLIPGIIKGYEYRMIPYILAENDDLSQSRVFALTKGMMRHNKWKTFVLDFSYVFWVLGTILTLGLLGIFFLNPYVVATEAELYAVLRRNVLENGHAESFELHGFYAS